MSTIVAVLSTGCALLFGLLCFFTKRKDKQIKDLQEQVEELVVKNIAQAKEQSVSKGVTKLIMSTMTEQQRNDALGQQLHYSISENMTEVDAIELAKRQVELHRSRNQ